MMSTRAQVAVEMGKIIGVFIAVVVLVIEAVLLVEKWKTAWAQPVHHWVSQKKRDTHEWWQGVQELFNPRQTDPDGIDLDGNENNENEEEALSRIDSQCTTLNNVAINNDALNHE